MKKLSLVIVFAVVASGLSGCGVDDYAFSKSGSISGRSGRTGKLNRDDPRIAGLLCEEEGVKICHVPEGNPSARHTICVGISGAVNGHGVNFDGGIGGHGGDTAGECEDSTSN